jgi:hypothetical protein
MPSNDDPTLISSNGGLRTAPACVDGRVLVGYSPFNVANYAAWD